MDHYMNPHVTHAFLLFRDELRRAVCGAMHPHIMNPDMWQPNGTTPTCQDCINALHGRGLIS